MTTLRDILLDLIHEYKSQMNLLGVDDSIYENEEELIDGVIESFLQEK